MGYTTSFEGAGRYSAVEAGQIVIESVLLDDVAICEPIAEERGAPMFHPYKGDE